MARDTAYQAAEERIDKAQRTQASSLNLRRMGLSELPEALFHLARLQTGWSLSIRTPDPFVSDDCNTNGLPGECDHDLAGDSNNDQIIDLTDHASLIDCLAGPGNAPGHQPCFDLCLAAFDQDHDGDVDLRDASAFNLLLAP